MSSLIDIGRRHLVAVCLLALTILAGLTTPYFWTFPTLLNILAQASVPALLATGACFVIGSGQIDLSVGSLSALGGLTAVYVANRTGSLLTASAAVIVLGLAAGVVNGGLSRWVPSFIVTLGTMGAFRGLALIFSGFPVSLETQVTASDLILKIGPAALVALLALLIVRRTRFGLLLLAVGSNEDAARNAGIRIGAYRVSAFAVSGMLAALSGALVAFRLGAGGPTAGTGYELDAIAAAIIGGAALTGGRISISGSLAAAILFSTIQNSFALLNLASALQQVLTGCVFVAVVLVQMSGTRRIS